MCVWGGGPYKKIPYAGGGGGGGGMDIFWNHTFLQRKNFSQSTYHASRRRRSTTQTYSRHVAVNFFYRNFRHVVFDLFKPEHEARVPAQWCTLPAHV